MPVQKESGNLSYQSTKLMDAYNVKILVLDGTTKTLEAYFLEYE